MYFFNVCVRFSSFAFVTAFFFTSAVLAADPAILCESGKLKEAGKYASCRLSADSKAVKTGDPADYSKCNSKFSLKWPVIESKGEGQCPGGEGDEGAIQNFIDACDDSVADALAGGTLLIDVITCNDELATCQSKVGSLETGQTTCWDSAGTPITCTGTGHDGDLQRGVARSFTDNGDGTITDNVTGLMWEKLSDDGSIHDKDATHTWANAFVKVATLNTDSFATYTDWRLPNRFELETLANLEAANPAVHPAFDNACTAACTVTTCSCTKPVFHWSSTTKADVPTSAWGVIFDDGDIGPGAKGGALAVRAVRGGS